MILSFLPSLGAVIADPDPGLGTEIHLALERSAPAAGAEVHMVHEIGLWFTQSPQENSVSVRLIDAGGSAVDTGEAARDQDDPKSFRMEIPGHLAPGEYTVAWRAMGDDGHVVRGDFAFTVMAH
jgi:methionine-rich copper-binding protein CopC